MMFKTLKEKSIFVEGLHLFKRLPRHIGDKGGLIEGFKSVLDLYLT